MKVFPEEMIFTFDEQHDDAHLPCPLHEAVREAEKVLPPRQWRHRWWRRPTMKDVLQQAMIVLAEEWLPEARVGGCLMEGSAHQRHMVKEVFDRNVVQHQMQRVRRQDFRRSAGRPHDIRVSCWWVQGRHPMIVDTEY